MHGGRSPGRPITGRCRGGVLLLPAGALAHVERPSYFPDPAPDTSVKPAAGGKVPKARSLASALKTRPPGRTRVVCQKTRSGSRRARSGVHGRAATPSARATAASSPPGRPSACSRSTAGSRSSAGSRRSRRPSTASRNNDRVVIMPGLYLEPTARAQPTNDPACKELTQNGDRGGRGGRAVVRVPGHLPERPEPGRRARPRARRRAAARPAALEPPRHPGPRASASAATCRSRAPASAPTT